jgi:hypothetical protein
MKHSWNKDVFWVVNNNKWRKWCKFAHISYFITLMANLCAQWTPNFQIKYFIFDWSIYKHFVLNKDWKRDSIQIIIWVNVCSTYSIVELKMRFDTWMKRNDVNGLRFFHPSYLIILMAYMCAQWTPFVQNIYIIFNWSFSRIFVLNRCWKREPFQIIWVYVCSTYSLVEPKTRFEGWITRNFLNGVCLFQVSYLITPIAYLCARWTPNGQIKNFVSFVDLQSICVN